MGACIFFIVVRGLEGESINQQGYNNNLQYISVTIFTGVIMIDTIKLCMQVRHWTKLLFFTIIFLSLAPYISFMWVIDSTFNQPVRRILVTCFTSPKAYFCVFLSILILMGINGISIYIRFHSNTILKRMRVALQ
jgi:RsiW-degrading membrane proteinase PrsW (M82 family)